MTVENVSPVKRYLYTGPGNYYFSFLVFEEGDLQVVHTASDGTQTILTLSTDYTVSINPGVGGYVSTTFSETSGTLSIERVLDFVQDTAWENEGALDMQLLEQDFDKLVMLMQQLRVEVSGAGAISAWRGEWVTATYYYESQTVWNPNDEKFYTCAVTHTSGTFATDFSAGYWFLSLDLNGLYEAAITAAVSTEVASQLDDKEPDLGLPSSDGQVLASTVAGVRSWVTSVPVGSMISWPTETPPTGWLERDGSAISRTTYSALFSVIGTMYGPGDGSTTFNLPDARGEFERGWDHGASRDPDKSTRTDRGDGTTGDHVGTKQGEGFKAHTHTASVKTASTGGGSGLQNGTMTYTGYQTITSDSSGGNETRPRNTNVMPIIKY